MHSDTILCYSSPALILCHDSRRLFSCSRAILFSSCMLLACPFSIFLLLCFIFGVCIIPVLFVLFLTTSSRLLFLHCYTIIFPSFLPRYVSSSRLLVLCQSIHTFFSSSLIFIYSGLARAFRFRFTSFYSALPLLLSSYVVFACTSPSTL